MSGQGQQRLNVVPTVTTLGVMKARLVGAVRGHAILKKKSDALTVQFRSILGQIVSAKETVADAMRVSTFTLTEAKYAAGDHVLRQVVVAAESARSPASCLCVRSRQDNVAGVRLPSFKISEDGAEKPAALMGLGRGGVRVQACRAAYTRTVEVLVELASLQTSLLTLDGAIKSTNRRVNALENVVKPRIECTIAYIKGELDELEREEFFRLKKIQDYKKRVIERQMEAAVARFAEGASR
ncbi:hypothetical protein Taro_011402 [Colocasia esculenta]|uniref:V-type proton ATPase subunit D n=1 Tax=Colocasia esculenta TaxID=4460 RepID=A0A843U1D8_COLES|nr:hypothetical protein [Colocasia esculenta]